MLFLAVLQNAAHSGAPKYPKRFVNPAMGLLHCPNLQVKSVLALLKINRRFSNKLTIKPAGRTYHYQKNLL
jgi:hypothetical protein